LNIKFQSVPHERHEYKSTQMLIFVSVGSEFASILSASAIVTIIAVIFMDFENDGSNK